MLRADFIEGQKKQMYKYFDEGEAYSEYKPKYPEILAIEKSDSAREQGTSIIGVGRLTETNEGEDAPVSNPLEGFTTFGKNRTFKDRLIITLEAQDDHQRIEDMLRHMAKEWGRQWPETQDDLAAKVYLYGGYTAGHNVFNNDLPGFAATGTGSLCYDNKPFFNLSGNTRASKGGGTYYNGAALDLTVANFKTQWDLMTVTNAKNEKDLDEVIEPDTLIVGGGAIVWTARTLLESTLIPGSTANDKNLLNSIVNLVVWRKITDTDFWCLTKVKKGKVFQERRGATVDFFEDKRSGNWEAVIIARAGVRIDNFRFDCASNFSTS